LKFLKNFLLYPVNFFLAACIIFFVSSFSTATFLKNFEFYDLPLSQDEVDYALAAKRGIAANYLDSETLSFFDFILNTLAIFAFGKIVKIKFCIRLLTTTPAAHSEGWLFF